MSQVVYFQNALCFSIFTNKRLWREFQTLFLKAFINSIKTSVTDKK